MAKRILVFLLVMCFIGCAVAGKPDAETRRLKVSLLGSPLTGYRLEARTINTLKLFNNQLYLGYGDWNVNTGPTDVIYYDPDKGKFIKEFTVQEEAITKYCVVDDKLAVTGTDATESWDFGNIYVLAGQGWVKHRTIPNAVHVFDAVSFKDKWYVGTGAVRKTGPNQAISPGAVFSSADQGASWTCELETQVAGTEFSRIQSLAVFKDKLYAFFTVYSKTAGSMPDHYGQMDALASDGGAWNRVDLIPCDKIYRTSAYAFKDALLIIIRAMEKDANNMIYSLYAYNGTTSEKLDLPQLGFISDVLVKDDRFFMVIVDKDKQLRIAETQDLKSWTYHALPDEIKAQFQPYLNGPKIEYDNGVFYIGTTDGNIFKSVGSE